jgi:ABC-type antimicrobial peptide transport system permease subunit
VGRPVGQRALCLAGGNGIARGLGRIGRDACGDRYLRDGLLLGEQTVRIALGAQPKEVLRSALGRVFRLLAAGSAVGLLLGLAATKVLSLIVYQATPRDPVVLFGVVVTMLLLGLLAAWIPAQRALAADPLMLLREE